MIDPAVAITFRCVVITMPVLLDDLFMRDPFVENVLGSGKTQQHLVAITIVSGNRISFLVYERRGFFDQTEP